MVTTGPISCNISQHFVYLEDFGYWVMVATHAEKKDNIDPLIDSQSHKMAKPLSETTSVRLSTTAFSQRKRRSLLRCSICWKAEPLHHQRLINIGPLSITCSFIWSLNPDLPTSNGASDRFKAQILVLKDKIKKGGGKQNLNCPVGNNPGNGWRKDWCSLLLSVPQPLRS